MDSIVAADADGLDDELAVAEVDSYYFGFFDGFFGGGRGWWVGVGVFLFL